MTPPGTAGPPAGARAIAAWLFVCAGLVFAMVLLGGLTRLTESGLSMVGWKPLTGWLPPLDRGQWLAEFEAYRRTPEFRLRNSWMTVEDFRGIFWLEYLHRLFGRVIGVVYLLPYLWFAARFRLSRRLLALLAVPFVLGGVQGVLGWYMVRSGLVDEPAVSHYALAAHLALAAAIYVCLLHFALRLRRGSRPAPGVRGGAAVTALAFATMVWGAFLAGLDGGAVHNTFPLMNGRLLPEEFMALAPWWRDVLENVATVQFGHRLLAVLTAAAAALLWFRCRGTAAGGRAAALAVAVLCQFALGAVTVLHGAPLAVAWLHQAGAMVVLSCGVWASQGASGVPPDAGRPRG